MWRLLASGPRLTQTDRSKKRKHLKTDFWGACPLEIRAFRSFWLSVHSLFWSIKTLIRGFHGYWFHTKSAFLFVRSQLSKNRKDTTRKLDTMWEQYTKEGKKWLILSPLIQSAEQRRSQIFVMAVKIKIIHIKNSQNVLHLEYSKYTSEHVFF